VRTWEASLQTICFCILIFFKKILFLYILRVISAVKSASNKSNKKEAIPLFPSACSERSEQ
jgi:hypothetical protein